MPDRFKVLSCCLIFLFAAPVLPAYEPPSTPAPRPFRYATDTFAFANETVWNYVGGTVKSDSSHTQTGKRDYTRHCFVVSRAAVQFWKFARFDPKAAPLSVDQLAERIRKVTERSVWLPPLPRAERIVFPGYSNLREISSANPGIFQENIGLGWPVYFRAGNAPIALPLDGSTEARLNDEVLRDLGMNYPTIVWLYRFPSLAINHVVIVISGQKSGNRFHYLVYDPNYTDGPKRLDYDPAARAFSYQPTFYFKGGAVDVRALYRGVLQ